MHMHTGGSSCKGKVLLKVLFECLHDIVLSTSRMQKQEDDYLVLKLQVPHFLNGHSQVLLLFFIRVKQYWSLCNNGFHLVEYASV
jgi:hypothetical protein